MSVLNGEAWVQSAVCPESDPELFFPSLGESARAAKRICMGCPVRVQCLQYALDQGIAAGVWGGFSAKERIQMRRGHMSSDTKPSVPSNPASRLMSKFLFKCKHCGDAFFGQACSRYCSDECRVQVRRLRQRSYHKRMKEQAS